jgi:predicted metal-dependent phosphoesterase TrpH
MLKKVLKDPQYAALAAEYMDSEIRPFFTYRYAAPLEGHFNFSLHNHSDGKHNHECMPLEEIARVAAYRGYDVIGITNHHEDESFGKDRIKSFEFVFGEKSKRIYLIKGVENRSLFRGMPKDIVFLGYEGKVDSTRCIEDNVKQMQKQGGIVIATSSFNEPFYGLDKSQLDEILPYIDAIEVFNSASSLSVFTYADIMAKDYAIKNKKAMITANDAHVLPEYGLTMDSVRKEDFPILSSEPINILAHQAEFIDALKQLFHSGKTIRNKGYYIPLMSVIHPKKHVTLYS